MLSTLCNILVLAGIVVLIASLANVRKIIRQLPVGRARGNWSAMGGLIALFVAGYAGYLGLFRGSHVEAIDLIVPAIFFFGAGFVWFSTFIALQTTLDVLRIGELEHETFTDPLTGIYNRRFMERRLAEEISKARRYAFPLSVLLLDLDHFKRINDEHGHQAGDRLLIDISARVQGRLRDSDILSRYGGEEFLVIAPNTAVADAALLAERLRADIEAQAFLEDYEGIGAPALRITASIGVAGFGGNNDNPEALIGDADRQLYRAKSEGRNRVAGDGIAAAIARVGAATGNG